MIDLLIFDMDGLMFDTERLTFRSYMEVVKELGYEPTKEQYFSTLGLNIDDICKLYIGYFGADVDAMHLFRAVGERKYEIIEREGLPVKKGLAELLDALDQKGIRKAVASSAEKDVILHNLMLTKTQDRFDLLVSAKDPCVKRGKPYPDIFLAACEQMGVVPSKALVLEDSNAGIRAALAGEIPVIGIPDLVDIEEELIPKCKAVLPDLKEVISYL